MVPAWSHKPKTCVRVAPPQPFSDGISRGKSFNGRITGLHPVDEGSIPFLSTMLSEVAGGIAYVVTASG